MKNLSNRYIIKIPKNISIIYCKKNQVLIFFTPTSKKLFKLKTKIILVNSKNLLKVTKIPFLNNANNKKFNNEMQKTTIALLKQLILELKNFSYQKLKLIGVGYKVFPVSAADSNLLNFKLGYSHQIFFKIPSEIKITCLKSTKLFISGESKKTVNNIASLIRSYKVPEVYKGKGILYENEKLILKEGKKI